MHLPRLLLDAAVVAQHMHTVWIKVVACLFIDLCVLKKQPGQYIVRYGGNVGSETWPFWLDVQVRKAERVMLPCDLSFAPFAAS